MEARALPVPRHPFATNENALTPFAMRNAGWPATTRLLESSDSLQQIRSDSQAGTVTASRPSGCRTHAISEGVWFELFTLYALVRQRHLAS